MYLLKLVVVKNLIKPRTYVGISVKKDRLNNIDWRRKNGIIF